MSDDLNSFIRNRVTVKSNDFKSLFGNVKYSKPYINIRMHFDLSNSKVISSEAALPTLPNIALAERKKDFFAWSRERLNCRLFTTYVPK